MRTSIFIKTCLKDLPWLSFCLRSIRKFCRGFEEVLIVADEDCKGVIEQMLVNETLFFCKPTCRGYVYQQIVKFRCLSYLQPTDAVLFVDSDVCFFDSTTHESFFLNNKPVLLKTKYGQLEGDVGRVAEKWQNITETFVGYNVEYEYMRRIPIVFLASTIASFEQQYSNQIESLNYLQTNDFSEFNCLGAHAEFHQPHEYAILDTQLNADSIPKATSIQYWSWGGISNDIRSTMESFLK